MKTSRYNTRIKKLVSKFLVNNLSYICIKPHKSNLAPGTVDISSYYPEFTLPGVIYTIFLRGAMGDKVSVHII